MSNPAERWNKIYQDKSALPEPALVLQSFCHLLPASGRALDLACGLGANSVFLAKQGLTVDAYDISEVALSKLQQQSDQMQLDISTRVVDLVDVTLSDNTYDVIVVSRYLERTLFPKISSALKPSGIVMYQTFTQSKVPGSRGPSNPEYLLAPGELLRAFSDLTVIAYRDDALFGQLDKGWRNECYLVAAKPKRS